MFVQIPDNTTIVEQVDKLRKLLIAKAPADTTSINIFINCEGITITSTNRSAESLEAAGISMRNIAGEFIRVEQEDTSRD